jgi:hypothetical protein
MHTVQQAPDQTYLTFTSTNDASRISQSSRESPAESRLASLRVSGAFGVAPDQTRREGATRHHHGSRMRRSLRPILL